MHFFLHSETIQHLSRLIKTQNDSETMTFKISFFPLSNVRRHTNKRHRDAASPAKTSLNSSKIFLQMSPYE